MQKWQKKAKSFFWLRQATGEKLRSSPMAIAIRATALYGYKETGFCKVDKISKK
jgi:hypothetical protein